MVRVACILFAAGFFLNVQPALALQEEIYSTETFSRTFVYPNIPQFSPTPAGGLGWDAFTDAPGENGAQAHAGKDVLMRGYMFPLGDGEMQDRFLFGPFPVTCPYHYHVPPALMIEAHPARPVAFTYEPILLRGRLERVTDSGAELQYRMHDAVAEPSESLVHEDAGDAAGQPSFHPLFRATPMDIRRRGNVSPDAPAADGYTAQ